MNKRILIFGVSGMVGHTLFKELSLSDNLTVFGTVRDSNDISHFPARMRKRVFPAIDVLELNVVESVIQKVKPDIIINSIGIIKQLSEAKDIELSLKINSLWPHQLVGLAKSSVTKIIHLSSDCVYSGKRGMYAEDDAPDPNDIYGQTKWLGELLEPNTLTIRTSFIGHELHSHNSLLEWFLAQHDTIDGYHKAIFSGLTTIELVRVLLEYILPNINKLSGIFHISSNPINKYDLLRIIATKYHKQVTINKVEYPVLDRSLDSSRFVQVTGYQPPSWEQQIEEMYEKNI